MYIDTKNGRVYVHMTDSVYMQQRFWKAEVRGRTVITTMEGHFCETGTTKKSYQNEAAADRAARADYAKKLRVGFVPIPEIELIPLMRLVFRIGYLGEGNEGRKRFDRPSKNVVYACRIQKFWRGRWTWESFFTTHGDIGGETVTKTFPQTDKSNWAMILDQRAHVHMGRGCWYQSLRKELAPIERYVRAMNKRLAKKPPAPVDLPAPERPVPTIVARKSTRTPSSR